MFHGMMTLSDWGSTFGHQNHWQLPHGQNIIMHSCNVAHALDDTERRQQAQSLIFQIQIILNKSYLHTVSSAAEKDERSIHARCTDTPKRVQKMTITE
jgi:hypothetical protein